MSTLRTGLPAAQVHACLKDSLAELERAGQCAVFWFSEIHQRQLYRELGYSSIHHYAADALTFSRSRTAQFLRLSQDFQRLPALKAKVESGELGWTKARTIARVATTRTEGAWIEHAQASSRRELEQKVARVRAAARVARGTDPRQGKLEVKARATEDVAATPIGKAPIPSREPPASSLATLLAVLSNGAPSTASTPNSLPEPPNPPNPLKLPENLELPEIPELPEFGRLSQTSELPDLLESPDREERPSLPDLTELAADLPVRVQLDFTPEEYARYEALVEALRKRGDRRRREELHLDALELALAERMNGGREARESHPVGEQRGGRAKPGPGAAGDVPAPSPEPSPARAPTGVSTAAPTGASTTAPNGVRAAAPTDVATDAPTAAPAGAVMCTRVHKSTQLESAQHVSAPDSGRACGPGCRPGALAEVPMAQPSACPTAPPSDSPSAALSAPPSAAPPPAAPPAPPLSAGPSSPPTKRTPATHGAHAAPPYQVVVYVCERCGKGHVPTSRGEKALGPLALAAIICDALVSRPGQRNRSTIPPRLRRQVLERDHHRCAAPGCEAARFIHVHHIVPKEVGGVNELANLITLCASCHRLAHQRAEAMLREMFRARLDAASAPTARVRGAQGRAAVPEQ